ncbi:response regulator [Mucilaginibacter ginsenosidivorax]|uniref:Response regulator n=2 Tax=Mucilaginibacter ginsenosidivorax TaxID=862126 RepID=A0A5B8W0P1_9SPHI|nr:response regulator [Mucilaginibacter ginsenosidivorax]
MDLALSDRYEVEVKTNGYNVLENVIRFSPDLIMLDNYIGQKNAGDIINEIKPEIEYRNIPYVLFSGHDDIRRIAEKINATAYLPKPFALNELYDCVDGIFAA